jgi:hypothetical protein
MEIIIYRIISIADKNDMKLPLHYFFSFIVL